MCLCYRYCRYKESFCYRLSTTLMKCILCVFNLYMFNTTAVQWSNLQPLVAILTLTSASGQSSVCSGQLSLLYPVREINVTYIAAVHNVTCSQGCSLSRHLCTFLDKSAHDERKLRYTCTKFKLLNLWGFRHITTFSGTLTPTSHQTLCPGLYRVYTSILVCLTLPSGSEDITTSPWFLTYVWATQGEA